MASAVTQLGVHALTDADIQADITAGALRENV